MEVGLKEAGLLDSHDESSLIQSTASETTTELKVGGVLKRHPIIVISQVKGKFLTTI